MSDESIITRLKLLMKYLEEKLDGMSMSINPDTKYIEVVYCRLSVCRIFVSGNGYNVVYGDDFLMNGSAPKTEYVCLEHGIPTFIRSRVDFYKVHTNKKGQNTMMSLEGLRDYIFQEIGNLVTVIYDRATGRYCKDHIRIKYDGCFVCSIYYNEISSGSFDVVFYDPFTCISAGYSPNVNLTGSEIPKAIKNRIDICTNNNRIDININADDNTVAKAVYMMARGNGKTRLAADIMKSGTFIFNGIKDVIFNDPATIVFWVDGSKTVVKCQPGETFDPEKGLAMAISKKVLGNDYGYYETFSKYIGRYNKKHKEK